MTLAEKPNSLYKNRSWQDRYDQDTTTTDSEEVDSDSGYSSPMHRRNQASNGTHPAGPLGYVPPGMLPAETQAIIHKAPVAPYPYLAGTTSMGGPVAGQTFHQAYPSPAGPSYNAPYTITAYQPPISSSLPIMTTASATSSKITVSTNNNISNSKTMTNTAAAVPAPKLQGNVSAGSAKTDPEEAAEPLTSAGKRRRRKNRKRKKKNVSSEETGALSDEPMELHRTHSSSNVSRTSTEPLSTDINMDSGLHFEDEEEFPDLLSASASMKSGVAAAPHNTMSYSDILKSQVSTPF